MCIFPTFPIDFSDYLTYELDYMDQPSYDILDLVLSNYGLMVEDLYSDGRLVKWKSYSNCKEFQDFSSYVFEENRKHNNSRVVNSKFYNDF